MYDKLIFIIQDVERRMRILTAFLYIYVYPFCLYPEDDIPSGSCNFSRIENSNLVIKFDKTNMIGGIPNGKILIYAINYNILQITQGMAGLLYSN